MRALKTEIELSSVASDLRGTGTGTSAASFEIAWKRETQRGASEYKIAENKANKRLKTKDITLSSAGNNACFAHQSAAIRE